MARPLPLQNMPFSVDDPETISQPAPLTDIGTWDPSTNIVNPPPANETQGDILKRILGERTAVLPEITADKGQRLRDIAAQKLNTLSQATEAKTGDFFRQAAEANAAFQQEIQQRRYQQFTEAQHVLDKANPESEINKGKWVTALDQEYGSLYDQLINTPAAVKAGASEVLGSGTSAFVNMAASSLMKEVSPEAMDAYLKEAKNKKLSTDRDQFTIYSGDWREMDQEVKKTSLTEAEAKLLDQRTGKRQGATRRTNRELIEEAYGGYAFAETLNKGIDKILAGTKHHQSYSGDKLIAEFQRFAEVNSKVTDEALADIKNGDIAKGIMKAGPAYILQILQSIDAAVKDPAAALQIIAEEMPDLILARFGPLGLSVSTMESVGRAATMEMEGITKFIDEKGRLPSEAEFNKITSWSRVAGSLDMASDLVVSGAGKGLKAALLPQKAAIKSSSEPLFNAAAQAVKNTGIAITTESLTEGAESLIDDFTSELREIGSTKSALVDASAGAVAGGGMGPTVGAAVTGAKAAVGTAAVAGLAAKAVAGIATAGANTVKDKLAPKTEARKQTETASAARSAVNYKSQVEEAVKADDLTPYTDPKSKSYNPILAVDALKAKNLDAATTPEAKIDNLNQALTIFSDLEDALIIQARRKLALLEKQTANTLTAEEKIELRDINASEKKGDDLYRTLGNVIMSMQQTKLSPEDLQDKLKALSTSTDAVAIDTAVKEIFANNGGADVSSFGSILAAIQSNPATSPATKAFIRDVEVFNKSRQKMEDAASKNPDEVHDNIISGQVGEYNGINTYQKNISELLAAGNIPRAKKEFDTLTQFAASHRMKADTLHKLQAEALGTYTLTAEDKANLEILNKRKISPYKVSNPKSEKWLNMLSQVELEADLIEKSVKVASGLFTLNGQPAPAVPSKPAVNTGQTATTSAQVATSTPAPKTPAPAAKKTTTTATPAAKPVPAASVVVNTPADTFSEEEGVDASNNEQAPPPTSESPNPDDDKPSVKPNPPKSVKNKEEKAVDLSGIKVNITGLINGKEHTRKDVDAQEALDDINAEIAAYEEILNCVKKS